MAQSTKFAMTVRLMFSQLGMFNNAKNTDRLLLELQSDKIPGLIISITSWVEKKLGVLFWISLFQQDDDTKKMTYAAIITKEGAVLAVDYCQGKGLQPVALFNGPSMIVDETEAVKNLQNLDRLADMMFDNGLVEETKRRAQA